MKLNKKLIALISIICCFPYAINAKGNLPITVSKPAIEGRNNSILYIDNVVLDKDSTTITFDAYQNPYLWIKIAPESYLQIGNKRYTAKNGISINLGEEFYVQKSGNAQFSISFEPIPSGTKKFDFIEGDAPGAFALQGIDLTKSANDNLAMPINSLPTTFADLEAMLHDAGYQNFSFDLLPLLDKDYILQIVVNEYENNNLINSYLVHQVNNICHLSQFSKESQEEILAEGSAANPEKDIYTQCEKLSIRFQPAQGDSIRICNFDFNNIGQFSKAFKLKKAKGGNREICRYEIRPFSNPEINDFEFCPLLLLGSIWYDSHIKTFRFCVENEFDKDMASESLNLIPHYYVMGLRAIPSK